MTMPSRPLPVLRVMLAGLMTAVFLVLLPGARADAASHSVQMSGYAFSPATLTLTAGDTVTWTNKDSAPHDVKTSSGPQQIHSPLLQKGESWSFTFTVPGTYGYYCTVHPDMTARIVVQPAPATTLHHTHSPQYRAAAPQPTQHTTGSDHSAPSHPTSKPAKRTTSSTEPTTTPSSQTAVPPTQTGDGATQVSSEQAGTVRPLDPLLLLAGVVTAVAVVCLLLVGSRSASATQDS